MIIPWKTFTGEIPRSPTHLLPENAAQNTLDCDFSHGELRPLKGMFRVSSFPLKNSGVSLFTKDGIRFYSWPYEVHAYGSPIPSDAAKIDGSSRIYYSSLSRDGGPKGVFVTTESPMTTTGGEPVADGSSTATAWPVGVPASMVAPILAVSDVASFPDVDSLGIQINVWYESQGKKFQTTENVGYNTIKAFRQFGIVAPAISATPAVGTGTATPITTFVENMTTGTVGGATTLYSVNGYVSVVDAHTVVWGGVTYANVISYTDINGVTKDLSGVVGTTAAATTTPTDATFQAEIVFTDLTKNTVVMRASSSSASTPISSVGEIGVVLAKTANTTSNYTLTLGYGTLETRAYIYTLVNDVGEEGVPSPADLVTVDSLQRVTVRCTVQPYGNYRPVDRLRLYRSNSATNGVVGYQFVSEQYFYQGFGTLDIVDDVPNAKLAEVCPSELYEAPPNTLTNLTALPNGVFAACTGNVIHFSIPFKPWAWPSDYKITLPYAIVGMMVSGGSLLVTTFGYPYLITGSHPDSYTQSRLPVMQAGLSPFGMADIGSSIVYTSNDGLVTINGAGGSLEQGQRFFTRSDWRTYVSDTKSVHLTVYDGAVIAFNPNQTDTYGFMIRMDEAAGSFTKIRQTIPGSTTPASTARVQGVYVLPETDQCYVTVGGYVHQFAGGNTYNSFVWHSKDFTIARPTNFGALQIVLNSVGTVTYQVYADGVVQSSGTVAQSSIVRLTSGFKARVWSVKLVGDAIVKEMYLATTVAELQGV
jgi:hypothetical protein